MRKILDLLLNTLFVILVGFPFMLFMGSMIFIGFPILWLIDKCFYKKEKAAGACGHLRKRRNLY